MNGRIVRTDTADNLGLQGILCLPRDKTRRLVLHIHGSYGNFYENLFLDHMAQNYTATGTAFLSVNTRGHDYFADFKMKRPDGGYDSRRIGGIREKFEECVLDISAWLDFAEKQGFEQIILQGHSLGAMKAVYYGAQGADRQVCALFLVSPPDIFGTIARNFNPDIGGNLTLARKLAAEDPDAMMPEGSSYEPISAGAYLSLFSDPHRTGMFNYYDRSLLTNPAMNSLSLPVHAVIGSGDEYVTVGHEGCMRLIGQSLKSAPKFTSRVIAGANHVYDGFEPELSSVLAGWAQAY